LRSAGWGSILFIHYQLSRSFSSSVGKKGFELGKEEHIPPKKDEREELCFGDPEPNIERAASWCEGSCREDSWCPELLGLWWWWWWWEDERLSPPTSEPPLNQSIMSQFFNKAEG
jgi:hypothetical protein